MRGLIETQAAVREYRRRNLPNRLRGWPVEVVRRLPLPRGIAVVHGELQCAVLRSDVLIDLLLDHGEKRLFEEYMAWLGLPVEQRREAAVREPRWYRSAESMIWLCGQDARLAPALEELGVVSRQLVTTAGVNFLTDAFQNTVEIEAMNQHDSGTGVGAEAVGDTALGTPTGEARDAGTQSEPAANQYRTVATHTYAGGFAITEHGLFSAATSGTLWDRSVFSAINVVATDSIEFTYTNTSTAGG